MESDEIVFVEHPPSMPIISSSRTLPHPGPDVEHEKFKPYHQGWMSHPPPPPPPVCYISHTQQPPPPPGPTDFIKAPMMTPPLDQPPPPPPPPAPYYSREEVQTSNQFIPVQYPGKSISDFASRMLRIGPFRRNVLMSLHPAKAADYKEYECLLKYGISEIWYEKLTKEPLRSVKPLEANHRAPGEFLPLHNARPVSLETPKVWASAAMNTPVDDVIYDSEAIESTPLVYCLVFTTCQAADPFIHGAHFNGHQIYKLVKCGSREAAVLEAFYAAGNNGWSLAFSCVMKLSKDLEERPGTANKVNELKVFY